MSRNLLLFALAWSVGLIGCAGGAASGMLGMFVALVMSGALFVACASDDGEGQVTGGVADVLPDTGPGWEDEHGPPHSPDTEASDTTQTGDVDACDGNWEPCCENGVITTCCCPEGALCNYGMFVTCEDGSCGACPEPEPDATPDAAPVSDATDGSGTTTPIDTSDLTDAGPVECDGTWETCCENGVISTCCCPEGDECNYGMMEDCGDGTCVYPPDMCVPPEPDVVEPSDTETVPDVVTPDAGPEACDGTWQTCCLEGELDQCCCPEGAICNYWFETCPDGSCTFPDEPCAEPEPECDGAWESCCVDGMVDQCCCPDGVACNYGDFSDCGEGTCVGPMEMCPEPEPECIGSWDTCCVDGAITECCCPEGMACNYGMFMTCDDGTCVGPAEECKESE